MCLTVQTNTFLFVTSNYRKKAIKLLQSKYLTTISSLLVTKELNLIKMYLLIMQHSVTEKKYRSTRR